MKFVLMVFSIIVMSGCASSHESPDEYAERLSRERQTSEQKFTQKCESMIGKPTKAVIAFWGIPSSQYDIDKNTKLIEYSTDNGINEFGTRFTCKVTFTSLKEKIVHFDWKGNSCRAN